MGSYHPDVHISEVIHLSRLWSPTSICLLSGCCDWPRYATLGINKHRTAAPNQSITVEELDHAQILLKSKASLFDVGCVGVDGLIKLSPPFPEQRQSSWATTAQRHTSAGGENKREFNMDQSCIMHEVVHLVGVSGMQFSASALDLCGFLHATPAAGKSQAILLSP
jgi:hypothetical protein